ncbi:lysophospholipid acyltransferase LPEAT [Acrasis kona]|uniref:Lysophospholipid acyltransferase LPEAT n=1 Tax=Acrasis kona TaxID=1008807 RepID=A0AAW2YMB7_9EUKA
MVEVVDQYTSEQHFPFQRDDNLYPSKKLFQTKFWIFGLILLICPLRLIGILTTLTVLMLLMKIAFAFGPPNFEDLSAWRRWILSATPRMCRTVLWWFGVVKIRRYYVTQSELEEYRKEINAEEDDEGTEPVPKKEACIVVSNHVSVFDAFTIIYELGLMSVVAKSDTANYPIIGFMLKKMNTLFVGPDTKSQLIPTMIKRAETYDGTTPRLLIFPEGTTTNGKQIIHFHSGAFVPGKAVQPIVLRYPWKYFNPAWIGHDDASYLKQLMCQMFQKVDVVHFPPYYPNVEERNDPSLFAENVRKIMVLGANMHKKTKRPNFELSSFKYLRRSKKNE